MRRTITLFILTIYGLFFYWLFLTVDLNTEGQILLYTQQKDHEISVENQQLRAKIAYYKAYTTITEEAKQMGLTQDGNDHLYFIH